MGTNLHAARDNFIQGMSRIAQFWGFPKAMGAAFGAAYLSPEPLCLDDLVELTGVTKGAVSTNVRHLERLGLLHRRVRVGDRKDYYEAETDFWKAVKGILREREKSEFARALDSVGESLRMARGDGEGDTAGSSGADDASGDRALSLFYQSRLEGMQRFFGSLDKLVGTALALDELRIGAFGALLGGRKNGDKGKEDRS